jgi:hypothetical protein
MKIDVVMTATLRPGIVKNTFETFSRMFNREHNYKLYLNVDPVGEHAGPEQIYTIAKQYFSKIEYNTPEFPGFCKAVKWCVENTTADVIFYLEDDWSLLRPVSINSLIYVLRTYHANIGSVRLNRGFVNPINDTTLRINTSTGIITHEVPSLYDAIVTGYVEHPDVSFNPGVFDGKYLRKVSKHAITPPNNPEDQFLKVYREKRWDLIPDMIQTIYVGDGFELTCTDTGRKWMEKSNYNKPDSGFVSWQKRSER